MQGYHVARKAGWDTHGLAVEIEVEKRLGFTGKQQIEEYGIAAFNQACLDSVHTYERQWRAMTERVGYWTDLDHAYWTFTNEYVESVWWALGAAPRTGAALRGVQGPVVLRALRHRPVQPRGGAELPGGRRPLDLDPVRRPPRPAPAHPGRRRVPDRPPAGAGRLDHHPVDHSRQRRPGRPPGADLQGGRGPPAPGRAAGHRRGAGHAGAAGRRRGGQAPRCSTSASCPPSPASPAATSRGCSTTGSTPSPSRTSRAGWCSPTT